MKEPSINCAHDEVRDVVNLVKHPQNPNTHSDSQIELLAQIIKHQGWRNPVVVSKRSGYIVAGHGRLMAAEKLGLKQVPVDLQEFENEADELAHLVADNRIAELSETNRSTLADLITTLDTGEFNLDLTGFDQDALEELMTAAPPELDIDEFFHQEELDETQDKGKLVLQYTEEDLQTLNQKLATMQGSKEQIIFNRIVNEE